MQQNWQQEEEVGMWWKDQEHQEHQEVSGQLSSDEQPMQLLHLTPCGPCEMPDVITFNHLSTVDNTLF